MVEYFKNWMGIKNNKGEEPTKIILHKKEPKYYFDKKLNRWIIEGEEIEPE